MTRTSPLSLWKVGENEDDSFIEKLGQQEVRGHQGLMRLDDSCFSISRFAVRVRSVPVRAGRLVDGIEHDKWAAAENDSLGVI